MSEPKCGVLMYVRWQDDKKDEGATDAIKNGSDDDDDEDDEQEANKKKEGGLSNKKKKLERRMKIAELKQICNRPDVVEVHSSFQSSEPTASSFIFADKNPLRIDHQYSYHIFFSIPGLGCNCCRSKIACISQGIQKYSTCP